MPLILKNTPGCRLKGGGIQPPKCLASVWNFGHKEEISDDVQLSYQMSGAPKLCMGDLCWMKDKPKENYVYAKTDKLLQSRTLYRASLGFNRLKKFCRTRSPLLSCPTTQPRADHTIHIHLVRHLATRQIKYLITQTKTSRGK